ncbi:hypothetical protein [Krasilnikoviella flava]|uniref:hypothetical protein n=1 Tax=Krasilnikoviella flava TaxID=526729 RepID=UPI00111BFE82|nr:hypothetical protein [Krasilnikoviella flava]
MEHQGAPGPRPQLSAPTVPSKDWTRARGVLSAVAVAGAQAVATFALMFTTGLVVAVLSGPYEDLLSVVGWLFWSAVIALVTTGCALAVGVPLRLVPRLRAWWRGNGELMLLGALLGAALIVTAFVLGHPDTVDADGIELAVYQPHGVLLLVGWLLLAFFCAHALWPRRWTPRSQRRPTLGTEAARAE